MLGFDNVAGHPENAWLSTAFSEMLSTELAAGGKLRVVSGEQVALAKADLSLGDVHSVSPSTLARLRRTLQTDLVVTGSYVVLPEAGRIRLDVNLQDAASGETVGAASEIGDQSHLFDLVTLAGAALRKELGVQEASPSEIAAAAHAGSPANPPATRLYSEALERLRQFDAVGARDLFAELVKADPNFAMAHLKLAEVYSGLGYDVNAQEEAQRAFELSGTLSREEQIVVEGGYRRISHSWDQAIAAYRTLVDFFPDNLQYGLDLARAQTAAGRGYDAKATLEALRRLPQPARDDPGIDLQAAETADAVSDTKGELAFAGAALAKAQELGARQLLARARFDQCRAYNTLGEAADTLASCEQARRAYAEAHDHHGEAWALNTMGLAFFYQGNLPAAREKFNASLAIKRKIGEKRGMAITLNNLANIYELDGDFQQAQRTYEESLGLMSGVRDRAGQALDQTNIANALLDQGNLAAARHVFRQSLEAYRETGSKGGMASALLGMGDALEATGSLQQASEDYQQALAMSDQVGYKRLKPYVLEGMGQTALDRGDLAAAQRLLEQALTTARDVADGHAGAAALDGLGKVLQAKDDLSGAHQKFQQAVEGAEKAGEKRLAFRSRVELAAIAIDQGRPRDAAAAIRGVLDHPQAKILAADQADAREALARALLEANSFNDARREIAHAGALAATTQNLELRLRLKITATRIQAANARPGEITHAVRTLDLAAYDASKSGHHILELQARLAMHAVYSANGQPDPREADLAALKTRAQSQGFALIARKASALRSPKPAS